MNTPEREEFYVGYAPQAPRGIARLTRRVVLTLLVGAVVLALVFVFSQKPFAPSFFEFGQTRQFEGVLRARPYPALLVERQGAPGTLPTVTQYALVLPGKHGAAELAAAWEGKRVKLSGSLIYRAELQMIEVAPDSLAAVEQAAFAAKPVENLGRHTLVGEIVDSKCYLGVMNPGQTKPHRECASLCIRGGIPPLFVVNDAEGRSVQLWLVSEQGEPVNQAVLDFVAEPVEITGQVERDGEQLVLRANPENLRKAP